jgi:hypothetical protein
LPELANLGVSYPHVRHGLWPFRAAYALYYTRRAIVAFCQGSNSKNYGWTKIYSFSYIRLRFLNLLFDLFAAPMHNIMARLNIALMRFEQWSE